MPQYYVTNTVVHEQTPFLWPTTPHTTEVRHPVQHTEVLMPDQRYHYVQNGHSGGHLFPPSGPSQQFGNIIGKISVTFFTLVF